MLKLFASSLAPSQISYITNTLLLTVRVHCHITNMLLLTVRALSTVPAIFSREKKLEKRKEAIRKISSEPIAFQYM